MKKLRILFFVFTTALIAQQANPKADSTLERTRYRFHVPLSINNVTQLNMPDSFFTDFSRFPELQTLAMEYADREISKQDFRTIQANLLKDFKQSMQWKADYSLGVFGQVLGYAMTAATFGLAVQHVVKYKDKKLFKNN